MEGEVIKWKRITTSLKVERGGGGVRFDFPTCPAQSVEEMLDVGALVGGTRCRLTKDDDL